jgi:hypothetical protein
VNRDIYRYILVELCYLGKLFNNIFGNAIASWCMLRAYLGMRGIGERTNNVGGGKCSKSYSCVAPLLHCLAQLLKIITSTAARGAEEANFGEGVPALPRYGIAPELVRRVRSNGKQRGTERQHRSNGKRRHRANKKFLHTK